MFIFYRLCPFVLSFFQRNVLDAIWYLIESVLRVFPTYFCSTDFYQSYGPLTIFQQLVLSLQLLLQFSVDFSETFRLLFPLPEEDHIIQRSRLTACYQS